MAVVHTVKFKTVPEMVIAIAEVYSQHYPRDPIPLWWDLAIHEAAALGIGYTTMAKTIIDFARGYGSITPVIIPRWWFKAMEWFEDMRLNNKIEPIDPEGRIGVHLRTEAYGPEENVQDE